MNPILYPVFGFFLSIVLIFIIENRTKYGPKRCQKCHKVFPISSMHKIVFNDPLSEEYGPIYSYYCPSHKPGHDREIVYGGELFKFTNEEVARKRQEMGL